VPRPGIGPGTRRFSVYQEQLTLEILQHLASIGQAAEQLLQSLQQDNPADGSTMPKIDESIIALEKMFKEGKIKE